MGQLLRSERIIPLTPQGGDFRCRRHHTYSTVVILRAPSDRYLGYLVIFYESEPHTRIRLCLAFQILFSGVFSVSAFTHSPLVSWASGLISYGWIHTSYPLPMRDVYAFLTRLHTSGGVYYGSSPKISITSCLERQ